MIYTPQKYISCSTYNLIVLCIIVKYTQHGVQCVHVTAALSMVLQVVALMFDNHYENPDEPITCSQFLNSSIYRLKAQGNLFGLPTEQSRKVSTNAVVHLYVGT